MFRPFLIAFSLLCIASLLTQLSLRNRAGTRDRLYWVTDRNPARSLQVAAFEKWQEARGYAPFDLEIDSANGEITKKLIQGVSGIGGDIMDFIGVESLAYFVEMGLLEDLTGLAAEHGFSPGATYPALAPSLVYDGRQYAFPCNIGTYLLIANQGLFDAVGMSAPPREWTLDEFEAIGQEYLRKRAESGKRGAHFFSSEISLDVIRRGYGVDLFNETLTGPAVTRPGGREALLRLRRWMDLGLIPSAADLESMSTEGGSGVLGMQLFQAGAYALFWNGRHSAIHLRKTTPMELAVCAPPFASFPNTILMTRAAALYKGGRQKERGARFLEFLASPEYSELIVKDGDGLPPLPASTKGEAFTNPPGHPNESGFHRYFAEAAETIGIVPSVSPYINPMVAKRIDTEALEAFKAGLANDSQAVERCASRIAGAIERTLDERPVLKARFEEQKALQAEIDARLRSGQKIPARWISNPFYLRYYTSTGQIEG